MTDVSTPAPGTRALVLGGGGVAGIAWEVGVLSALQDAGVDLDAADLVVGTSAGSVVGSFVRAGAVAQAYEQQHAPLPSTYVEPERIAGEDFQDRLLQVLAGATSEQDARARLGAVAQQVVTGQSDDERTATFAETLPSTDWPAKRLALTTIDALDGAFRVLTAESGVPLPRAVAASCSVPFVWSPVHIDGVPHYDGGLRSATNADVAAGYERVLVVACGPEGPSPLGRGSTWRWSPCGPAAARSRRSWRTAGRSTRSARTRCHCRRRRPRRPRVDGRARRRRRLSRRSGRTARARSRTTAADRVRGCCTVHVAPYVSRRRRSQTWTIIALRGRIALSPDGQRVALTVTLAPDATGYRRACPSPRPDMASAAHAEREGRVRRVVHPDGDLLSSPAARRRLRGRLGAAVAAPAAVVTPARHPPGRGVAGSSRPPTTRTCRDHRRPAAHRRRRRARGVVTGTPRCGSAVTTRWCTRSCTRRTRSASGPSDRLSRTSSRSIWRPHRTDRAEPATVTTDATPDARPTSPPVPRHLPEPLDVTRRSLARHVSGALRTDGRSSPPSGCRPSAATGASSCRSTSTPRRAPSCSTADTDRTPHLSHDGTTIAWVRTVRSTPAGANEQEVWTAGIDGPAHAGCRGWPLPSELVFAPDDGALGGRTRTGARRSSASRSTAEPSCS